MNKALYFHFIFILRTIGFCYIPCAIQSGNWRSGTPPPPPPAKNHKNKGFSSNTGPDPLKMERLPSQHSMLGHNRHASETPFNSASLAGRWWSAYSATLIIPPGPRSAVGNVSGYRCVSDCRSRGREFDPGPVPYFRGD